MSASPGQATHRQASATAGTSKASGRNDGDQCSILPDDVKDFRKRVRAIGAIVREAFGIDLEYGDACGAADAYRVVLARIIETLMGNTGRGGAERRDTEPVTTEQLALLSKALAEHRRLDIAHAELDRKLPDKRIAGDACEGATHRPLPGSFKQVVREIYGTNLADDRGE